MGNSQTKEARGLSSHQDSGSDNVSARNDIGARESASTRTSNRPREQRHVSRPDFSSILGLGTSEPDVSSLEARRESKAEREARRQEKEKSTRLKERERSMREEHVDGGYLVTQGVYVGAEDYHKALVRQLMIERRLAPFWRGINDFSDSWAEHQIMAVARGMALPPPDEVPPELEYQLSKRPSPEAARSLTIPMGPRSESFQSDSGRVSPASGSLQLSPSFPHQSTASSIPFRSRAKTLASLGSASRSNSEKDLSPREFKLSHDPFVNGQPIEVTLYKDASECPICFLYYPPYLNTTRCCEQPICSECFVQIKRPDPHAPEHAGPDPNAPPVGEEEQLAQAEGLLVSEVATCPYCKQREFGITYTTPPFRRGLVYGGATGPYGVMSARSSQTSVASTGLSPGPTRRRGISLSANAPEVITTDKIRPDWATKLATARAHAARRSAAASALHAAAYLMNDQTARTVPGPFGRRTVLRRTTLDSNERPSDVHLNALSFLAERHAALSERNQPPSLFMAPPRGSSSRRRREDEIEELMMMEAIRLSLAAEEERRRKEEKDAKKKAKKEEKEQKKVDKMMKRNGLSSTPSSTQLNDPAYLDETMADTSIMLAEGRGKGKTAERDESPPGDTSTEREEFPSLFVDGHSFSGASQESLTAPVGIPITGEQPLRRSHLRQMSNASSISSSLNDPGSNTPPVNEPMFNFQSLAAMIGRDEKNGDATHFEHAEDESEIKEKPPHSNPTSLNGDHSISKGPHSKLKEVIASDELEGGSLATHSK